MLLEKVCYEGTFKGGMTLKISQICTQRHRDFESHPAVPLVIDLTIDSDDEHVRIMPPKRKVRSQAMPVALKTSAELPLDRKQRS